MIILDKLASVQSSKIDKECTFDLDEDGLAVVLDILRSQLYSNKELAVIRETSSNSYDAMAAVGKQNLPISINLPTDLDPTFRARDYGQGLTYDEVKDVFVKYGASTKRNSNLFIGQKGIGAKSPFAYGDSFMVVSYQRGRKVTYTAYLDPSMVGKMAMLSDEETTEEDGLEVIVSVRENDVTKFQNEAKDFFKYWVVRPTFTGHVPVYPKESNIFEGKQSRWIIPAKSEDTGRFETPVAIMGNVAYPLSYSSLDWTGKDFSLRNLFNVGVRMWMDIGDIEVSASREALQYTAQTQASIFKRLEMIRDELQTEVNTAMASAKSFYDAKVLFIKVFDLASPLYLIKELFTERLKFDGKDVTNNYWDGDNQLGMGALVKHFHRSSDSPRKKAYSNDNFRIYADTEKPIIVNDTGSDWGILSRIAPLVELDNNHLGRKYAEVQVVSVKDAAKWAEWTKTKSYDAPMILLSSLPKVPLLTIYPADPNKTTTKRIGKVFKWRNDGYRRRTKSWWTNTPIDLSTEEGVYVEIKQYKYNSKGSWEHPRGITDIKNGLENAGIVCPNIYGVTSAMLKKNTPGKLVALNDYICQQIRAKLDSLKVEQIMVDRNTVNSLRRSYGSFECIAKRVNEMPLVIGSKLAVFASHCATMVHKDDCNTEEIDTLRILAENYHVSLNLDGITPSYDIAGELYEIRKTYPLLFAMDDSFFNYYWDTHKAAINHYVGLVEQSLSKDKYPDQTYEEGAAI